RSGRVRVALGEYVGHQSRGGQRRADGAVEDGTFSEHAAADLGSRRGRAVDEVLQCAHGVVIQFRGRAAEQDAPWIDDAGAGDDQPRPRLEHLVEVVARDGVTAGRANQAGDRWRLGRVDTDLFEV